MRILLLNANTTQAITDRCAAAARAVAMPGTEIVPVTASRGPQAHRHARRECAGGRGYCRIAGRACAGSCDAAVIAVSFDTALDAAREAAPFPVVGMTEAALHAAAMLGGPIGFIGPVRRVLNVYRDVVARTGLNGRIAGYRPLDMRPQDFADPANMVAATAKLANELVEQDHAESIVVAGRGARRAYRPRAVRRSGARGRRHSGWCRAGRGLGSSGTAEGQWPAATPYCRSATVEGFGEAVQSAVRAGLRLGCDAAVVSRPAAGEVPRRSVMGSGITADDIRPQRYCNAAQRRSLAADSRGPAARRGSPPAGCPSPRNDRRAM